MAFIATAIGGVALGIGGSLIQSHAADNAAKQQIAAAKDANYLQDNIWKEQQQRANPYMQAGQNALGQMQDPYFQKNFSMSDFQADPGYAFRLQQGQQALERSAAARGGLQSGGTLKALNDYAQNSASNEYQNAYNRFTNDQNNRFSRLSSLSNLGYNSMTNVNNLASNYANQYGQNLMGAANAQAAGTLRQGQIWGGTLSSLGNAGISAGMQGMMMGKAPMAGM